MDVPLKDMPWWANVLEAAEAWGVPPWEITGNGSRFLWYSRWMAYTDAVNRAVKERRERDASRSKNRKR